MSNRALIICLFLLAGCDTAPSPLAAPWQEIAGRDDGQSFERIAIYRARVPSHWQRIDPASDTSIADTTLPLCQYMIDEKIRIAVHNFPAETIEGRIPPGAQVARWRRQLDLTSPTSHRVLPVSHGGFVGLHLEGPGITAWAMQLAAPHFRTLQPLHNAKQCCADYTIKATGPQDLLTANEEDIHAFARSFELIEEIPSAP